MTRAHSARERGTASAAVTPRTVDSAVVQAATLKLLVAAYCSCQSSASAKYQRSEKPGGGNFSEYALVNDTGYPFYPQALSIRTADKAKLAPCLKKLVPLVQRAQVDFLANPDKTNAFVIDLVTRYHDPAWSYDPGLAKYAIDQMRLNFVNDGADRTLGNFDVGRAQRLLDIVTPERGSLVAAGANPTLIRVTLPPPG